MTLSFREARYVLYCSNVKVDGSVEVDDPSTDLAVSTAQQRQMQAPPTLQACKTEPGCDDVPRPSSPKTPSLSGSSWPGSSQWSPGGSVVSHAYADDKQVPGDAKPEPSSAPPALNPSQLGANEEAGRSGD